jgi:hypothetical protein
MRWPGEILKNLINPSSQPYFDEKKRKVLFFSLLGILAVFCIMSLFSFEYAGSKNPVDLFQCRHINYSYAGHPVYTHVYTDRLDMAVGSVNNATGNLTIGGASEIRLSPASDILLTSGNGTEWRVKGPITVYSLPETSTDMLFTVTVDDDFNYILRLTLSNQTRGTDSVGPSILNITKRSDTQYLIKSTLAPGPRKSFSLHHERCAFPIDLYGYFENVSAGGREIGDIRKITYDGQIDITTDGGLSMRAPVSMMIGATGYRVNLDRSEGTLDIRHTEYKTNAADNIQIVPLSAENGFVSIINGQVTANGIADSLVFREHDFKHPITVVLQEGNFALLTGLLMSVLTVVATRIIIQFKKR